MSIRAPQYVALPPVVAVILLSGCGSGTDGSSGAATMPSPATSSPAATPSSESTAAAPSSATTPAAPPSSAGPRVSKGRPQRARLSIPALGIRDVTVVGYRGVTDDAAGTAIQDRGLLASPHGPRGGTGPGGVGNYQVTGHRLSSTRVLEFLPDLERGDRVRVRAGASTYVYRIVRTRKTSFRSPSSLRAQRAAVPGRPGLAPTRAMITVSTCATPEDRAAGNNWSDEFGNPEHRIDKIGVLVATRRTP